MSRSGVSSPDKFLVHPAGDRRLSWPEHTVREQLAPEPTLRYSLRRMEAPAEDRAGQRKVLCDLRSTEATERMYLSSN